MPKKHKNKQSNYNLTLARLAAAVCIAVFLCVIFLRQAKSSTPLLANYYLGTIPLDGDSVKKLAKNDLLILSSEQAIVRKEQIAEIKRLNPKIILLAYVPAESYNNTWKSFPANAMFGDFTVKNNWWLRDTKGKIISDWPGVQNTDLNREWSDYLISFIKNKILTANVWDGIFYDRVNGGISGTNRGDIDLNKDGLKDDPVWADNEWINRVNYLLDQSRLLLKVKYIVINGTSVTPVQNRVNGRMYEDYPTPWEKGGWSGIMTGLSQNQLLNRKPQMYIFNVCVGDANKSISYKKMRFGLASSLLLDNVYFSLDYGITDHTQMFTFDEYKANLGDPVGKAISASSSASFKEDVWRRDYAHGLAIVNTTNQSQTVDLGGEYEKITGQQDPTVNDGSIVSNVTLGAKDGLIMLKTFQSAQNIVFVNGGFLRFFDILGNRSRNGFFAFTENIAGGANIYQGDLDNDGTAEQIIAAGNRLKILNSRGQIWYNDFPFGGNYKSQINLAVGKLGNDDKYSIVATGDTGGRVSLYTYYGDPIKEDVRPLGTKYTGGFSVAIGNINVGSQGGKVLVLTQVNQKLEVLIYNPQLTKILKRFTLPDVVKVGKATIAAGDVNDDSLDEIIISFRSGNNQIVKILTGSGKLSSQFKTSISFGGTAIRAGALDVNYDGKDEVVLMNAQ